jgi:hypothetical protein
MITGQFNKASLVPSSTPVHLKLHALVVRPVILIRGALRSSPAEMTGTFRGHHIRPSDPREHPVEQTISVLDLEPAQEPESQEPR